MTVETIKNIKPGNPYRSDLFRMGTSIDNNIEIMFEKHVDNAYIIVVNQRTGERIKITF
jgi:hypothetical protein